MIGDSRLREPDEFGRNLAIDNPHDGSEFLLGPAARFEGILPAERTGVKFSFREESQR
jgi:hypothetical protein